MPCGQSQAGAHRHWRGDSRPPARIRLLHAAQARHAVSHADQEDTPPRERWILIRADALRPEAGPRTRAPGPWHWRTPARIRLFHAAQARRPVSHADQEDTPPREPRILIRADALRPALGRVS